MKQLSVITILVVTIICLSFNLKQKSLYNGLYNNSLKAFKEKQELLLITIQKADVTDPQGKDRIRKQIGESRTNLKALDFWLRYLEPVVYKKLNGPLPVEWENEVFEKFENPYRREGAGLSLASLYLEETSVRKDSLSKLIVSSIDAIKTFEADSITKELNSYHHFFLANRLYLLNMAAIYTTGFECPDTSSIIPELLTMLKDVREIYSCYNKCFPAAPLTDAYLEFYNQAIVYVNNQSSLFSLFDHFDFIRDYVNPLFRMNQELIRQYDVVSRNYNDYSLNNFSNSIFSKALYLSQNSKGIYSLVEDDKLLAEIKQTGRLLFYDPVLSGNNLRSCASCHKPMEYFTDTTQATALNFDKSQRLTRNTPSLINTIYNHLLMLDGKHISLQNQAKEVILNPVEMNSLENEMIRKVLSCRQYKNAFSKFLKYTPEEKEITLGHIVSAITFYYADFSKYDAAFDDAMNKKSSISREAKNGFNLFMSKAQCGTCHFIPLFNGVKPPYIGSEFEVLGVPDDTGFTHLSKDSGRHHVNPAPETRHAFRTGTLRNNRYTPPYMHNGIFRTLEQVIDFYDAGGGQGKNLPVDNQTLSADSLRLTMNEKKELIAFLESLNENIIFESPPASLPSSSIKRYNERKVAGEY